MIHCRALALVPSVVQALVRELRARRAPDEARLSCRIRIVGGRADELPRSESPREGGRGAFDELEKNLV